MTDVPNNQAPTPGDPVAMVKGPAIGLMVVGGIGIAFQALGIVLNLLGVAIGGAQGGQEGMANMFSGAVGLVLGFVGIIVGIVIFVGALKMQKLQSYGFAMTAAVIAMIPCISPCCLLGLPIGIWALVVLMKPEVKSAFH